MNEISELNVYNPHSGVSGEISESPARLKNPDRLRVSALKHPPPPPGYALIKSMYWLHLLDECVSVFACVTNIALNVIWAPRFIQ